jgi:hypothetical protein
MVVDDLLHPGAFLPLSFPFPKFQRRQMVVKGLRRAYKDDLAHTRSSGLSFPHFEHLLVSQLLLRTLKWRSPA